MSAFSTKQTFDSPTGGDRCRFSGVACRLAEAIFAEKRTTGADWSDAN